MPVRLSRSLSTVRTAATFSGGRNPPAAQEPAAVQPLQPLAVLHVALAAGNHPDLPRVDEDDLHAVRFQQVRDGYPVHAGAFHRRGLHAALREPREQLVQLRGRRPEMRDVVSAVVAARAADVVVGVSRDVDARDVPTRLVECGRWLVGHGRVLLCRVRARPGGQCATVLPGGERFRLTNDFLSARGQS